VLIGLCGYQGVGKSTLAEALRQGLPSSLILPIAHRLRMAIKYGIEHYAKYKQIIGVDSTSQDLLKVCIDANVLDPWQKPTPDCLRQLLIRTANVLREIDPDHWINLWHKAYESLPTDLVRHVIVDDVRYENEAVKIISRGGVIVKLRRMGIRKNPKMGCEDLSWFRPNFRNKVSFKLEAEANDYTNAKEIIYNVKACATPNWS
jgi:deoxyadenosine/deoxycytidine kinase